MPVLSRCPRCSRILFLDNNNKLPHHRVPAKAIRMPKRGDFGSVPLTGRDAKWCAGIG